MTTRRLFRKREALAPLLLAALATVLVGWTLVAVGVRHEADESAAARLWQLLMVGQLMAMAWFAIKWLPRAPRGAIAVLVVQGAAFLLALAPILILGG